MYKRLSSLWNGVCYKRGVVLYLYYSMFGTGLSVSCTQVSSLCLSFTPRESFRDRQVGPAGLPLAGRPRDVAIWPPPLSERSGSPPEVGRGCIAPTVTVRGRPASPRLAGLALARLGLLFLLNIVFKAHIASQVDLDSDSSGSLWIWA